MEMPKSDRGERLRSERERLSLSQSKLAEICGTSKSSQILYEKGKAPSADYLEAFGQAGGDLLFVITGQRRPDSLVSDRGRLTAAIEAVEAAKTSGSAARRAELILAAYDLITDDSEATKARVIRLLSAT